MALKRCEDCGHKVSDLAFACPQCARPMGVATPPREAAGDAAPGRDAASAPVDPAPGIAAVSADAAAHPVVAEWLGGLRQGRELPARTKVCKRCDADVALDTFRQKVGDGYLCSDCLDDAEARRAGRQVLVWKALGMVLLVVAGVALTATALRVAPLLTAPRSSRGR